MYAIAAWMECLETFVCDRNCSSCFTGCDRVFGRCLGDSQIGTFGEFCNKTCSEHCRNGCTRLTGICYDGCTVGKLGDFCNETCDARHVACCNQYTATCKCLTHFFYLTKKYISSKNNKYFHMGFFSVIIEIFCRNHNF